MSYKEKYYENSDLADHLDIDEDVHKVLDIEQDLRSKLFAVADTLQKNEAELGDVRADPQCLKHTWRRLTTELDTVSPTMLTATGTMTTLKQQIANLYRDAGLLPIAGASGPSVPSIQTAHAAGPSSSTGPTNQQTSVFSPSVSTSDWT
jgi:hypothetical protein